uniref:DUF4806 domain-containing protein n=1 Tax=Photinus pyralis TaxID=7054 RepID=A0A1Y1LNU0_PHOPY
MSYAVVSFIREHSEDEDEEDSTSEVPMSWLSESNTKCWWPVHSKNVTSLIKRMVPPNPDKWVLENVKVEALEVSLERARKLSTDCNYVSTDEGEKGRGKRKVIQPTRFVVSDEDELAVPVSSKNWRKFTNVSLPPQLPIGVSTYNFSSPSPLTAQNAITTEEDIQTMPVIFSDISTNLELEDYRHVDAEVVVIPNRVVQNQSADFRTPASHETNKHIDGLSESNITEDTISSRMIQEHFQKISRMFVSINMQLKSIDKRIQNLEKGVQISDSNQEDEGLKIIKEYFPLKSTDAITTFDTVIIENKEVAINFRRYINGIGGTSSKDSLVRILQRIFTNACAEKCSWLGRKNNFAIHKLHFVSIIKGMLIIK